ncbi:hypothetical protein F511_16569 [Dorcoceras hygrometricum]|uniref:Uncharacterized protein n=1 Tax=Dorcoceras hygrometricum TaxID=472368 RepID=A0A2Z7AUD5_9LAMI|nr:hypothetical protein F511_16569 [Dorcoceras hygrometricum]
MLLPKLISAQSAALNWFSYSSISSAHVLITAKHSTGLICQLAPDLFQHNQLALIRSEKGAFPTYSIRVPRVTLSIQTGYTSTASRVDNDKQIPQLLFIVLSRCSTIVVLQQTQKSAVVITSRNNSNPVATLIQSQHFKAQNDVVLTNSNDVVTSTSLKRTSC